MKQYKYFDFVMAAFVTVLLLSNVLSSAKIIDLGVSLAGLALVFDAGTLVFPISYIFGDILTEVYGYQRARRVIWVGFAASVLFGFFTWLAGVLPAESFWQQTVGQAAYDGVLGGISGLIVASLAAYWLGSFSNSYVMARMKVATRGRWLPLRTITSTLIGQLADTSAFIVIATLLGVFPVEILFSLILTNYLLKVGIEVLFTPVTVRVVAWLKRAEGEDYYDTHTRFNPFSVAVESPRA